MGPESTIQPLNIPLDLCNDWVQYLRDNSGKFIHVNKQEEPPLRKLSHGLAGEGLTVQEGQLPPYPYMIKDTKAMDRGKDTYYHGFRFDGQVCDEAAHVTPRLRSLFGPGQNGADNSFRQVLSYSAGSYQCPNNDSEATVLDSLFHRLAEAILPSVMRVYNVGKEAQAVPFSLYANLVLPGQNIEQHLDVPQFIGVDRSNCPSWLLVAAHCSGLFPERRVKNVTVVCYPALSKGGALAIYGDGGMVVPVVGGTGVALDTDSHFHQSELTRGKDSEELEELAAPLLPDICSVNTEQEGEEVIWKVISQEGEELMSLPEAEVRFSLSCKFHIFNGKEEAARFQAMDQAISGADIVKVLEADLKQKGKLKKTGPIPLHELGPILVREYILPLAPTAQEIENMWRDQ